MLKFIWKKLCKIFVCFFLSILKLISIIATYLIFKKAFIYKKSLYDQLMLKYIKIPYSVSLKKSLVTFINYLLAQLRFKISRFFVYGPPNTFFLEIALKQNY